MITTCRRLNPTAFNAWVWRRLADYSHPLEVYYGGAGSGKSYGAAQKVLLKAMNARRKVLVIRKVGTTLRDSIFQLFLDLLADAGISSACDVNKTDMRITLPNGSMFIFKGLDDREKIKSITGITVIVVEEATEITEDDFTQLRLRLRPPEPNPQIYLMFNPVSKANWVYSYFFLTPPADALVIQTTYKDNRFLPPEYCATLEDMQRRNPAYYRIYALGEFATLDKLVFPCTTRRLVSAEECTGMRFWCGLDFGYVNDPSALVWGWYDEPGRRIFITGEYVRKGLLNDGIADAIKALGLSKEIIVADCAEQKSIAEIKRAGISRIRPAEKGKDSVVNGLAWMNQHEIIVDERLQATIEEFDNYTWVKDKKTGEYINEPIDAWNHCIDAARYGLQSVRRQRMKTYQKSILGL